MKVQRGTASGKSQTTPMITHSFFFGAAAGLADGFLFRAPYELRILKITSSFRLAGTGTWILNKCASGTAPASGTAIMAAASDLSVGSVDTVKTEALHATDANAIIPEGSYIAIDSTSPATATGINITIEMMPTNPQLVGFVTTPD